MTKKKTIIYTLVSAFLTLSLAINYDTSTYKFTFNNLANSGDIFWLIIFILFLILIAYIEKIKDKRLFTWATIAGTIISMLNMIGFILTNYILAGVELFPELLIFIIVKFILKTIIYSSLVAIIYNFINNYNIQENNKSKLNKLFVFNKKNFIIICVLIFIAYVPWLINYYPGICSADSAYQMIQVDDGIKQLTNHHPIFHTLIIGLCLKIGNIFSDNNMGIAIYSIIQMIACAITFSFSILYCGKKKVPVFIQKILLLFFMFCPIIASYSITMWKDIPFALCILITTILLIELTTNSENFFSKKKNSILLALFLILDILFRKNGIYCVFLAAIIFIIFTPKKYKKKLILPFLVPIVFNVILTGPIFNHFNIVEGDSKEAFSIFMQQFARIRKNHSNELSKEEKKELDRFFISKEYVQKYDPVFADPVKRIFSEKYIKNHKKELLITYGKYALKYPKDTVIAFLAGSYGYYYPNVIGWEVYNKVYEDSVTKSLEVQQTPIKKIALVEKLGYFLNNHNIPILSTISTCGFYFWLLIVTICYYIYKKRINILPSISLLIGVWGTALLSPVFCERRYVYSMFIVVPILFALCFCKEKKKKRLNSN